MKNQIKYLQNLFYDLLNDYGQVYIVIRYSENSDIGNRGFTEEEKKKGIVLIFNPRNHKNLQWTEEGSIIAALGFGANNKPEKCFLHFDDIVSVFSPYAKVRFDRWDIWDASLTRESGDPNRPKSKKTSDDNVVSLDRFRKTKPDGLHKRDSAGENYPKVFRRLRLYLIALVRQFNEFDESPCPAVCQMIRIT